MTVLALPSVGAVGAAVAAMVQIAGGVLMVVGAVELSRNIHEVVGPGDRRHDVAITVGLVVLGAASATELVAVVGDVRSIWLAVLPAALRIVAVLTMCATVSSRLVVRHSDAERWHATLLTGLVVWLPLLGVLGSMAWHVSTGRADAASLTIEGAGALLLAATAVAPFGALLLWPGRHTTEPARVPAVRS